MATVKGHLERIIRGDSKGQCVLIRGARYRSIASDPSEFEIGDRVYVRTRVSRVFGRMADILKSPDDEFYAAHWPRTEE